MCVCWREPQGRASLTFVYGRLCQVFAAAPGLRSGCGHGLLSEAASLVAEPGPWASWARGILLNHRSTQYPLRWQANSQPLGSQGSPEEELLGCRWIFYFFLQLLTTLLCILCEMSSCCTLNEAGAIFYECYTLKRVLKNETTLRLFVHWQ